MVNSIPWKHFIQFKETIYNFYSHPRITEVGLKFYQHPAQILLVRSVLLCDNSSVWWYKTLHMCVLLTMKDLLQGVYHIWILVKITLFFPWYLLSDSENLQMLWSLQSSRGKNTLHISMIYPNIHITELSPLHHTGNKEQYKIKGW